MMGAGLEVALWFYRSEGPETLLARSQQILYYQNRVDNLGWILFLVGIGRTGFSFHRRKREGGAAVSGVLVLSMFVIRVVFMVLAVAIARGLLQGGSLVAF